MTRELVDRPELAIENILRYQTELRDDARLAGLMKSAHTWFAARSDDGAWLFAPSKFVGYAGNTANDYLAGRGERGGRDMERVLRRWFALVPPETALTAELGASLARFVGGYGHSGPRKGARICVLKEILASGEDAALSKPRERILVDPAICGGRPHIRGTRVRVSDILDMLAAGATPPPRKSLPIIPISAKRTCARPWPGARRRASTVSSAPSDLAVSDRRAIAPEPGPAGSAQGAIRRTTSMRSVSARLPMTKSKPSPVDRAWSSGRRMPTSPPGRSGPRGRRSSGYAWATRPMLRFGPGYRRNCRPSKPRSPAGSS